MKAWRALVLVAAVSTVGAGGSLLVGVVVGMRAGALVHLALLLVPAVLATGAAVMLARPVLAHSPIRVRLVALVGIAAAGSLANLIALAHQMFVSGEDATTMAVLVVYSLGAGVGAAVALGSTTASAVDRLARTARSLGDGDLDARVGTIAAEPELVTLGATLDQMASSFRQMLGQIEEVERQRRDLITAVSHDLRTPLAGLRAMVEAIEDGVVDDQETLRRYLGEMGSAVGALATLTNDLFELVQLDAGVIADQTARVCLLEVIRAALAACEGEATAKGLAVQVRMNRSEDTLCSPRLSRVVQNLLQNAVRHTPADGSVVIDVGGNLDEICVEVADTGEGIPPEALAHVFEPFFRADFSRHDSGAGLGLTLAKRIVDRLGGRLEAESEPNQGARFRVVMPCG